MSGLYDLKSGVLTINLHPGQVRAWDSTRRIVAIIAGAQSGKTAFSPIWLWREIKRCGPGDYGFICPNFTLMEKKALPEFKALFQRVFKRGMYVGSSTRKFIFHDDEAQAFFGRVPECPTQVFFGYAENPDSLESATYKAVVCDEAGQKAFKLDSWYAVQRRLAIHQGRCLIGTTPYSNSGFLKTEIYDRWKAGDPDIDLIRFASNLNPAFPREEFERARRNLPAWKFQLFYKGEFAKPAGLIYDSFDETRHKCPRVDLPIHWQTYLGLDFGGVNTAGVFYAKEPETGRYFAYREYKAGGRTAKGHVTALLAGEKRIPICVGGSKSEGQWRAEFQAAGLPVMEPRIHEVEIGIDRCYGAFARGEITVFNDLAGYLEELTTYARETDTNGNVTEEIEDKSHYHFCDAQRYILGYLMNPASEWVPNSTIAKGQGNVVQRLPRGVLGR